MAPMLKRDVHYEVDERKRTVGVTEEGVALVEDQLGIDNLYEAANTPLVGYLNNALKAKELYKRDKDYIVRDGQVLIVDEFTGRVLAGRRYNEGMHQAIEAKEGVEVQAENQTLATITLQNYFRLYAKLVGHDRHRPDRGGRAAPDLQAGRGADPDEHADGPRRPGRPDLQDRGGEVRGGRRRTSPRSTRKGQPVLVGTTSVEKSEYLSKLLVQLQVPHEVLNAKQHEREAAIVAQAGPRGRGHGRHQHGRPRHRHHARRQPRVPRRHRAARAAASTRSRRREEYEAAWDEVVADDEGARSRPRPRRSATPAGCTCWAPSGTSRAASTTSCAAGPAARATPASPASTSRSATS